MHACSYNLFHRKNILLDCFQRQRIETLINEEALLLAKYIRNEKIPWIPRIPKIKIAHKRVK
jgi:hypothetical protein